MVSFRGTSKEQDPRYRGAVTKPMLPSINVSSINFSSLRAWIKKKVEKSLGCSDDIVSDTLYNMVEECYSCDDDVEQDVAGTASAFLGTEIGADFFKQL